MSQSESPALAAPPPGFSSSSSSPPPPPIPNSLARMLQQHQQFQQQHRESPHKAFVCEICGKAFRFRSNLAEHRSVHTAVKPFVCKFCGKSSRLKGNLTKHILKHHKSEQRDYIGTDDYIIKKGKKSVKDPAAIEFLERSMIVLNNSARSGMDQSGGEEEDTDGQGQSNNIFLSLGLDSTSLDLKTESSSSEGGDEGLTDFSMLANNNERLLENCESAIDSERMDESGQEQEGEEQCREELDSSIQPREQEQMAGLALAAAACKAIFGQAGGGAGRETGISPSKPSASGDQVFRLLAAFEQSKQEEGEEEPGADEGERRHSASAGGGGGFRLATQCKLCGKHFRKPRDLIAHLSTAHESVPSQNANGNSPSPSFSSTLPGNMNISVASEPSKSGNEEVLRELRQLKAALTGNRGEAAETARVEQLLVQLDSRVCRLEKQLEMALNSIYTLVQLQTGINSSVSKLSRSLLNNQP